MTNFANAWNGIKVEKNELKVWFFLITLQNTNVEKSRQYYLISTNVKESFLH